MRPERLVGFFESIAAFELDDQSWLTGVASATKEVWGRSVATTAAIYDASDPRDFRVKVRVSEGVSDELRAGMDRSLSLMTPELVTRVFRRSLAGDVRTVTPELAPVVDATRPLGVSEVFAFCGSEPNGHGCSLTLKMAEMPELFPGELEMYGRMALHLGAAFRCRQRLHRDAAGKARLDRTAGAEAILDSAGRVVHAEGPAKARAAQERLQDARRRFDRARARDGERSTDPLAAARAHSPVVDARWTLVDAEDSDGARFVVARENQAAVCGLQTLSARERQVVVLLAVGRSSKEIAYALGISDSTTRVLLSRARARLGARTRDELIGIVTRQSLPGL